MKRQCTDFLTQRAYRYSSESITYEVSFEDVVSINYRNIKTNITDVLKKIAILLAGAYSKGRYFFYLEFLYSSDI
jgi:hypothetical protein